MTARSNLDADSWTVAGRTFTSRLIVGTGKYKSFEENAAAVEASGAEIVTVAVRRVNIADPKQPMLTDFIDPKRITYLPNTAGCFTGEEAVRTLRLAREAGGWTLVKLEVLGEAKTLYPDMVETLRATEILAKEGFLSAADDIFLLRRDEVPTVLFDMYHGWAVGVPSRGPAQLRALVCGRGRRDGAGDATPFGEENCRIGIGINAMLDIGDSWGGLGLKSEANY